MANAFCARDIKRYHKTICAKYKGKDIGDFEELYFAPVEITYIYTAIEIFVRNGSCPVLIVHIENLCFYQRILDVLESIVRYNKSIGYTPALCLEIRIRSISDFDYIDDFLEKVSYCNVELVLDSQMFFYFNQCNLAKLSLLRINYENINVLYTQPCFNQKSICYKLARIYISNETCPSTLPEIITGLGFDGLQIVKGHQKDTSSTLSAETRDFLESLKNSYNPKIDYFIENDTLHINQPMFYMKRKDRGICFSSLIRLAIHNGEILQCPYEYRSKTISYKEINTFLINRKHIDSRLAQCVDCGVISDNKFMEKLYHVVSSL